MNGEKQLHLLGRSWAPRCAALAALFAYANEEKQYGVLYGMHSLIELK